MGLLKGILRLLLLPLAVIGLLSKKTRKESSQMLRKDAVYLTFIIPLVIILYIVYMNVLPFGYEKEYVLDIGTDSDTDSALEFYLVESNALSPVQRYGDQTFREIVSLEPIEFWFSPPIIIDNETQIMLSIDFESNSTVYIKHGDGWNLFYNPKWESYEEVAVFEDSRILVNPDWISTRCWERVMVDIGFNKSIRKLPFTYREPLVFEALLQEELDLIIEKKEKNLFPGEDVLAVSVYDGESLIFNDTMADDGLTNEESISRKRFSKSLPTSGIYVIKITGQGSMPKDFLIESVDINSNMIILSGAVVNPIFDEDAAMLYSEDDTTISIRYWDETEGKQIVVSTDGGNTEVATNRTDLSGSSQVYFPRGDVSIYNGRWAFSDEEYFSYNKIQSFHDECVEGYEFEEEKYLDSWITRNVPYKSSIHFYNEEEEEELRKKYAYKGNAFEAGVVTEINSTLRGSHQFYVYLKDGMVLDVVKEDFNWYAGKDDLSVELYDMEEQLVFSEMIKDDGITDNSQQTSAQNLTFDTPIPVEGIYVLKLISKSENDDFGIKKIKINSNNFMSIGNILPLEEVTLYTESKKPSEMGFYYWHGGKDQLITIRGESSQLVNLSIDDEGKNIYTTLDGKNEIHVQKGDLKIITDMNLAFSNEEFFSVYEYDVASEDADFLIIENAYGSYDLSGMNPSNTFSLKKGSEGMARLINAVIEFRK
ncbi:MAG: hypothetical protein ABIC95_01380 [archaeon]